MKNQNAQTNRHGPQNKGCNQLKTSTRNEQIYVFTKMAAEGETGIHKASLNPNYILRSFPSQYFHCGTFR